MNYYVHELPPECVEMTVVSVQTPALLWLEDAKSNGMTRRYYEVEAFLKEDYKKPELNSRLYNVDDIVGVYDAASGAWCRAKICDIYPTHSKYCYTVFLLDRGHAITLSGMDNIRELPPHAKQIRFRCNHIQLFGIFPVSPEYGIRRPDNIALQAWSPAAMDAVKDLLNRCEGVYFTRKLERKVVYGEIHLKFDKLYVDLADYLCDNNFAFRDCMKFYKEIKPAPFKCEETRTVLQNIKAMEKRRNERWDGLNPSNDFQPSASETIPANKIAEGSKFSADKSRRETQGKTMGLAQFCLEMSKKDKPRSLFRNDQIGHTASQSPERYAHGVGRGQRLEILKTLVSDRKPGGYSINTPDKTDSLNDDQLTMIKKLSLDETSNPVQETGGQIFESEETMSSQRKITSYNNKRDDHTGVIHYNLQAPQNEKEPERSYTIFTRHRPIVYIPAGAESSMLASVRKKPQAKKKIKRGNSKNSY